MLLRCEVEFDFPVRTFLGNSLWRTSLLRYIWYNACKQAKGARSSRGNLTNRTSTKSRPSMEKRKTKPSDLHWVALCSQYRYVQHIIYHPCRWHLQLRDRRWWRSVNVLVQGGREGTRLTSLPFQVRHIRITFLLSNTPEDDIHLFETAAFSFWEESSKDEG